MLRASARLPREAGHGRGSKMKKKVQVKDELLESIEKEIVSHDEFQSPEEMAKAVGGKGNGWQAKAISAERQGDWAQAATYRVDATDVLIKHGASDHDIAHDYYKAGEDEEHLDLPTDKSVAKEAADDYEMAATYDQKANIMFANSPDKESYVADLSRAAQAYQDAGMNGHAANQWFTVAETLVNDGPSYINQAQALSPFNNAVTDWSNSKHDAADAVKALLVEGQAMEQVASISGNSQYDTIAATAFTSAAKLLASSNQFDAAGQAYVQAGQAYDLEAKAAGNTNYNSMAEVEYLNAEGLFHAAGDTSNAGNAVMDVAQDDGALGEVHAEHQAYVAAAKIYADGQEYANEANAYQANANLWVQQLNSWTTKHWVDASDGHGDIMKPRYEHLSYKVGEMQSDVQNAKQSLVEQLYQEQVNLAEQLTLEGHYGKAARVYMDDECGDAAQAKAELMEALSHRANDPLKEGNIEFHLAELQNGSPAPLSSLEKEESKVGKLYEAAAQYYEQAGDEQQEARADHRAGNYYLHAGLAGDGSIHSDSNWTHAAAAYSAEAVIDEGLGTTAGEEAAGKALMREGGVYSGEWNPNYNSGSGNSQLDQAAIAAYFAAEEQFKEAGDTADAEKAAGEIRT